MEGKKIMVKVFAAVFVLLQMAAVIPHHHHESSDSPCINPLHALEVHAHEGVGQDHGTAGCADGECSSHFCLHNTCPHSHAGGTSAPGDGEDCGVGHLDLNPPVRDRIALQAPVTDLPVSVVPAFFEVLCSGIAVVTHGQGVERQSVWWGTLGLYTYICGSSLPARAPSVLV